MKRIGTFLLALMLALAVPAPCFAAVDEKTVEAPSAVLVSADTGAVLFEKNAHDRRSPASVTKLMTMLLVAEALDTGKIKLTDTVTGSANAASKGGSQIWLEVGEQMTVEELLKAVVIASANDACTALAEFVAGSDGAFVQRMNARAKELGLQDTHFENCTGLDDTAKNHFSSAYDLAVIAREVLRHNWITKYTTVWLDSLRNGKTELNNTNKLVNTYDGITGLKTGTTEKAGFCLCATARRDGMQLIAVVLGAKTSEQRFSAATALLDSGFADYRLVTLLADPKKITQITVKNGVQKISYTCIDEYGAGTHENYDVMYAMAKDRTKDMNNGVVKFNFKHILSQVVFKAKTEYDNMEVDIDMIKIHNFKFAGAFTLPATAEETGSWSSSDLAFPHAFTVVKNANITVNSNTAATDISTNTPMLNIPQTLTAWTVSAPNKSKLEADNAKQCYLEISCKIRQSGAYLLGSASEYKTIYVPFGDTWVASRRLSLRWL